MKVSYSKIPAKTTLTIVSKINSIRIFVLWIAIFVLKSLPSYSSEPIKRNDLNCYQSIHTRSHLVFPQSSLQRVVPNYISLNTLLKTSYCTGESSSLYIDAQGIYNTGNVFSVVLSDSVGSFTNPTVIGTLSGFTSGVNQINFRIPINASLGTGYRIRIVGSNPLTTSNDNNFNIRLTTIPVPISTPQSICAGQSTLLAATCSTGLVKWYKSATGDIVLTNTTVSPTVMTNYYPACEDGTTCFSKRKVHTVTVNSLIGISLAPTFSACIDSDINLSVVTSQTGLTYNWKGPNGFTSTTKIATITKLTAAKTGTYSVSITNANNCSATATTVVSIGTDLPNLAITGNTSVCYDGIINLTAQSGAVSGMTYSWKGPNSFTATGQSISRVALTDNGQGLTTYHGGIYSVTATNLTTGCTGTVSVNILVGNRPNSPSVPASTAICEGTTQNIVVGFRGANFQNYSWTGPNGFTSTSPASCPVNFQCTDATISIPNFSRINVGTYSVLATFRDVNNKMCSISANTSLSIKAKPSVIAASNSAICIGQNLNLTATSTNAIAGISSYSWTGPNNFTSILQNPTVNAANTNATGVYTLVAVGVNQCVNTVTTTAIVTQSLPPVVIPTAQVVLSNSITLMASGCAGTIDWYKTADNQGVIMPVSPIVTTLYYAKCNLPGCVSVKSNDITVKIGAPIAISIKSGNWEDKTTWNINRVPLAIDSVIIDLNHVVVINGAYLAKWMSFRGNGAITFSSFGGNLNLLGNPPPPKTNTPTLLTVSDTEITYSGFSNGTMLKLYKNGVYVNQRVIGNGNTWAGLTLSAGLYTITAKNPELSESIQSNAIQYTPQTIAPRLLTVTGTQITFSGFNNGTLLKLYKNGVYMSQSFVANNSNWSGLILTIGSYSITATESGKSESVQSNAIQYSPLPQTNTPTLLAVNATYITYTNYTPGAVFKLYKNGVFTNDTFVSNGNEWTGLNLGTGLYTYTATESGKTESAQSNAVQFTQQSGQTNTPSLSTVAGNGITYAGYTNGVTLKLYRDGSFINQSYVANSNQWTGLNLITGLYTITATESGKSESAQSNSIQYTVSSTQTNTPTLLIVTGTRINYTGYSDGTMLKLYKAGVYTNQSYVAKSNEWNGLNLTNGKYSITATESGKTESAQSNSEQYTIPSSNTVIIEPNKPQYYFSDGHPASYYDNNAHLPAIFTNKPRYDAVNDLVWLKNDKIKIGINLKRGGQLAWASLIDATNNLVYNGYDGGFQITLDAYQKKDGYTQDGEVSGSGIPGQPGFSYNVTQGGDFLNNAVSLIDYHAIPNGYYVKIRPIHYPLSAKFSETYIEAWYTIIRQSVKIEYRYTSFRTDGQWDGGGFDGAGAPACFIVNTLNRYKTYTGNNPWTFSPVDSGILPIVNLGAPLFNRDVTEYWGMVYDSQHLDSGIGVYNQVDNSGKTYFIFKQLEVYPGNGPGTEFTNGFTFFQPFIDFKIPNRGNYVKNITAYLMLGTEYEIRAEAYRISGHEANIPPF